MQLTRWRRFAQTVNVHCAARYVRHWPLGYLFGCIGGFSFTSPGRFAIQTTAFRPVYGAQPYVAPTGDCRRTGGYHRGSPQFDSPGVDDFRRTPVIARVMSNYDRVDRGLKYNSCPDSDGSCGVPLAEENGQLYDNNSTRSKS